MTTGTPTHAAPLQLALIGLGPQGQEHLLAAPLATEVRIVAGVDLDATAREAAQRLDPALQVFDSLDALRHQVQTQGLALHGLILALPHHTYGRTWAELTSFGLPLLKEKPLARDQAEARQFLQQARQAGCPLQTAIQRRHHPSYARLHALLRERGEPVLEAVAHMHLGFAPRPAEAATTWREDAHLSGGGVLLDSGYHMVDLLHHVIGPFELVSASLMRQGRPIDAGQIEDRVRLTGRSESTWVQLDSWLHGQPGPDGRPTKSEGLRLLTPQHLWRADRSGVWCDDTCVYQADRQWTQAMAAQLDAFAQRIRQQSWHDATLWDQLPAMRVIDQAYLQSRAF